MLYRCASTNLASTPKKSYDETKMLLGVLSILEHSCTQTHTRISIHICRQRTWTDVAEVSHAGAHEAAGQLSIGILPLAARVCVWIVNGCIVLQQTS